MPNRNARFGSTTRGLGKRDAARHVATKAVGSSLMGGMRGGHGMRNWAMKGDAMGYAESQCEVWEHDAGLGEARRGTPRRYKGRGVFIDGRHAGRAWDAQLGR